VLAEGVVDLRHQGAGRGRAGLELEMRVAGNEERCVECETGSRSVFFVGMVGGWVWKTGRGKVKRLVSSRGVFFPFEWDESDDWVSCCG